MARKATIIKSPAKPGHRSGERVRAAPLPKPYQAPAFQPTPQALPVDPIYTGDIGAINSNYDNTMAGIGFDRTDLGQSSGFDQAGNLDPTNPYSVAANLQRRYQQGQAGTTNSMAAQGQLYSGALQRGLDEGTFTYSRDYDSARRTAMGGYRDLTERGQRAEFDKTTGTNKAGSDRISRLDPTAVTPQTPPGLASTSLPQGQWTAPINQAWVDEAQRLWNSGKRSGKVWGNIIKMLGYDPRGGFK